ncbi:unnamed protein product, partial [Mesorhabditis spiculigera]
MAADNDDSDIEVIELDTSTDDVELEIVEVAKPPAAKKKRSEFPPQLQKRIPMLYAAENGNIFWALDSLIYHHFESRTFRLQEPALHRKWQIRAAEKGLVPTTNAESSHFSKQQARLEDKKKIEDARFNARSTALPKSYVYPLHQEKVPAPEFREKDEDAVVDTIEFICELADDSTAARQEALQLKRVYANYQLKKAPPACTLEELRHEIVEGARWRLGMSVSTQIIGPSLATLSNWLSLAPERELSSDVGEPVALLRDVEPDPERFEVRAVLENMLDMVSDFSANRQDHMAAVVKELNLRMYTGTEQQQPSTSQESASDAVWVEYPLAHPCVYKFSQAAQIERCVDIRRWQKAPSSGGFADNALNAVTFGQQCLNDANYCRYTQEQQLETRERSNSKKAAHNWKRHNTMEEALQLAKTAGLDDEGVRTVTYMMHRKLKDLQKVFKARIAYGVRDYSALSRYNRPGAQRAPLQNQPSPWQVPPTFSQPPPPVRFAHLAQPSYHQQPPQMAAPHYQQQQMPAVPPYGASPMVQQHQMSFYQGTNLPPLNGHQQMPIQIPPPSMTIPQPVPPQVAIPQPRMQTLVDVLSRPYETIEIVSSSPSTSTTSANPAYQEQHFEREVQRRVEAELRKRLGGESRSVDEHDFEKRKDHHWGLIETKEKAERRVAGLEEQLQKKKEFLLQQMEAESKAKRAREEEERQMAEMKTRTQEVWRREVENGVQQAKQAAADAYRDTLRELERKKRNVETELRIQQHRLKNSVHTPKVEAVVVRQPSPPPSTSTALPSARRAGFIKAEVVDLTSEDDVEFID